MHQKLTTSWATEPLRYGCQPCRAYVTTVNRRIYPDLIIFKKENTQKTCDLIKSFKQVEVTRDFPRGDQMTFFFWKLTLSFLFKHLVVLTYLSLLNTRCLSTFLFLGHDVRVSWLAECQRSNPREKVRASRECPFFFSKNVFHSKRMNGAAGKWTTTTPLLKSGYMLINNLDLLIFSTTRKNSQVNQLWSLFHTIFNLVVFYSPRFASDL